ncbi:MAG TPA: ATP-dependent DNA helicase PcrA [Clostridiales bacterium]|nr:ATP-dependent DNA helicase PcrA [Clostridiales bacterium]
MNKLDTVKHKLFDAYYSQLNAMQRKAVTTVNGPLLVLAGAGSGKTTVLVKRIAHIIHFGDALHGKNSADLTPGELNSLEQLSQIHGCSPDMLRPVLKKLAVDPCPPRNVLSITFTNKAATEMKNRLKNELGDLADEIWAGTFHSICVRLLHRYIQRIGFDSQFTIYDTEDSKKVMADCIADLELDSKMFMPRSVLQIISGCKNRLVTQEEFENTAGDDFKKQTFARLFKRYQLRLANANALDFDDIILMTIRILRECEDVRNTCQKQFKYILVDEYQDTNYAQYILMRLLADKYRNVMVVGDDDQSIYKFRGATVENILNFDKQFTDTKTIYLEQNYRSTGTILKAANGLIAHNTCRKGKNLWTERDEGNKIVLRELDNQEMEARYLADTIQRMVRDEGYHYNDFAVLYRSNAQSNTLENVFTRSALPHRLLGGTRFNDRREIKDIHAYLSVINNPKDTVRLERIINLPKRNIGVITMKSVVHLSEEEGVCTFDIIKNANQYPALSKTASKLMGFANVITELQEIAQNKPLPALFAATIEKSGYMDMLLNSTEDEKDRIANVNELISNAVAFTESNPEATLAAYLEENALVADIDNYHPEAGAVVLMTMHSSKGLEFPVVFLPGMEENVFPSVLSQLSNEEIEEERRLAYVAITRAKKELFLTYTRERLIYGRTSSNRISRFVEELPQELMDSTSAAMYRRFSLGGTDYQAAASKAIETITKKRIAAKEEEFMRKHNPHSFTLGEKVIHDMFGLGVVQSVKKLTGDTLYEITFEKAGTKKMMGTYAKLRRKDAE